MILGELFREHYLLKTFKPLQRLKYVLHI
jgi:hypothetical protein